MTVNKLQEAISLIKAGDRQTGQKLLTEVLNDDPRNETAWLWMSALVSGEQRRFCLEKVLSINPNHPQAREQLAKLAGTVAPPMSSPAPTPAVEPPVPAKVEAAPAPGTETAPPVSYGPVQGTPLPKVWLTPRKYVASIIYLEGNNLLAFDVLPNKAAQVLEEVRLGVTQKQFDQIKSKFHLMNVNHVLLSNIMSVILFGESLKIIGANKAGDEKKISTTVGRENSESVLKALHDRLGPDFQRTIRPISRRRVITSAVILSAITLCGSSFFWWFVRGLQADLQAEGQIGGSARARGLAALLLLIGPNGFLCIGGLVLVVVILAMVSSLRKPPEETVLARGAEPEENN
ncbi:MAG: hypothetical protein WCC12_21640 [Anaerolineales bacterium]